MPISLAYAALAPEYAHLLSVAKITRPGPVKAGVDDIMRVIDSYVAAGATSGVPAGWMGPTDCREDNCNPRCGIGQGDPWNQVSRHVPAGKGPFASKAEADAYYLHYDKIDVLLQGVTAWDLTYACWSWERWNGFGPRENDRLSGYLWSCTDVYDTPAVGGYGRGGKYVADNDWSPSALDSQPGAVALYLELIQHRPDLAIGSIPANVPAPSIVPAPVPAGVSNAARVQQAFNLLGATPPLAVDGNYGRMTSRAVSAFQQLVGLHVDGIAGTDTWAAIDAQLKANNLVLP